MKTLYQLIKREINKIITDSNLLILILVAPIAYPLLYGAIYINKFEESIPIIYLDEDKSGLSRALLREIDALQNVDLICNINSSTEFEEALASEKCQGIIYIPKNFEKDLKYGKQTRLQLMLPAGRLLVLSDVGLPINQIATGFGAKINGSVNLKKGIPVKQNIGYAQPISINFQYLNNAYLSYGDLILPAIIVIILSQIIVISAAESQAKEWSLNQYLDQFSISDNILKITFSKIITYFTIFLLFSIISILVIAPLYNILFFNKIIEFLIISTFGILSSLSFGLFLGTFFKQKLSVFLVLGFTTYPLFMLSGYAWPQQQIPTILQWFSYIFPLTSYLRSIMEITQIQNELSKSFGFILLSFIQFLIYSILYIIRIKIIKCRYNTATVLSQSV